jgi:hypothetical protein
MAQEGAAGCGSSKLDTPAAIRHIAALLDDIAAALLKGQKKSLIALPVDVANEVHGLQRFHDGFNLSTLLRITTHYGKQFRNSQRRTESPSLDVSAESSIVYWTKPLA